MNSPAFVVLVYLVSGLVFTAFHWLAEAQKANYWYILTWPLVTLRMVLTPLMEWLWPASQINQDAGVGSIWFARRNHERAWQRGHAERTYWGRTDSRPR